jgi:hypothetical protein
VHINRTLQGHGSLPLIIFLFTFSSLEKMN